MRGSVAPDLDDPGVAREQTPKTRAENEVEFSRIVAFSDGVFSIAITLLILNVTADNGHLSDSELWDALWGQRENLIAYGISFAVIGRFWLVHHRFFGEVTAFDNRLIGLNMLYLGWIVLIPFSSQLLGDYGGQTPSLIVYALNLAVVVLLGLLMASRARRAGLTSSDGEDDREAKLRAGFIAAVFLLSIPVAVVAPDYAPLLWLALFFDPTDRLLRTSVLR